MGAAWAPGFLGMVILGSWCEWSLQSANVRRPSLSRPSGKCMVDTPLYFAPCFSHPSASSVGPKYFCSKFGSHQGGLAPTFLSGIQRGCGQIWNVSGYVGHILISAAARLPGAIYDPLQWMLATCTAVPSLGRERWETEGECPPV